MKQFSTSRLRATQIGGGDLGNLVDLHLDAEVSRFLGGVRSPEQTAKYLAVQCEHWKQHGFGLWALRTPGGEFVGRAGLRYVQLEGRQELEIAYALARKWWRQGLASKVSRSLVELWRANLTAPTLVGIVEKGNLASERVLLGLGLSYEREGEFHNAAVGVFRIPRSPLH